MHSRIRRVVISLLLLWLTFVLTMQRSYASNEIKATALATSTVYAAVLNSSGQVYNQNTSSFETIVAAGANWTTTKECISMVHPGTSTTTQLFVCSMPTTNTPAGHYSYIVYQQIGGAPAEADTIIAQGSFDWTGTAIASIAPALGTDGKVLLSANAQTGVTIPTVTTINGIGAGTVAPMGFFANLPNVTIAGYATNEDPAFLLFNSTLLSSFTTWATGSYGYYLERTVGSDWGGYTRNPTTGLITFTMPNGQTFTATISVNASGQITGRVTN